MPEDNAQRPDLQKLLAYWQPALGLTDWIIKATYERDLDNFVGKVNVVWEHRQARMRILEPSMVTFDWPPHDVELCLVHELVHCILDPLDQATRDLPQAMKERPVEQLAKALVRLHRVYPLENDWLKRP